MNSAIFRTSLLAILSACSMAQDPIPPFISRFVAHGVAQIEGFGPAAHATVSSNCGTTVEADSQGRFSVAGQVSAAGICTFAVSMPGCEGRSVQVSSPAGPVALGLILLRPVRGKSGAGTVSFMALSAPNESAKIKDRAVKAMKSGKFGDAVKELDKAIKLYDKDAEAIYLMGMVEKEQRKDAEALDHFKKAAGLDGFYMPPRVQLAVYALRTQDWPGVESNAAKVVEINPADYPEAWLYLATARLMQGNNPGSEAAARTAIETSGQKGLPKAHHILGLALAKQGKTADAIAEIRMYLEKAPNAADAAAVKEQLARLAK
jgi:tetratricopeptide (TPR) repeat protein